MKDIAIYRAIGLMTYTINPLYSYLAVFIVVNTDMQITI